MEKLELKHLAAYLPYKLKAYTVFRHGKDATPLTIDVDTGNVMNFINGDTSYKIMLRPLSELYTTKGFSISSMITHGYHNTFWSKEKFSVKHIYYHDLLILLEHHFDVFGLIDAGLAINKLTV